MYRAVQTMSQRFACRAGMSPSNPVLTIFSVSPSFLTTAWYASTSKPTGVVGASGLKNSIGDYSMSTQSDSSPGFRRDVGAAIPLGEGLAASLGDAATVAAVEGDAAALADGDAVAAVPLEH